MKKYDEKTFGHVGTHMQMMLRQFRKNIRSWCTETSILGRRIAVK